MQLQDKLSITFVKLSESDGILSIWTIWPNCQLGVVEINLITVNKKAVKAGENVGPSINADLVKSKCKFLSEK